MPTSDKLKHFFGKDFSKEERTASYDFIETYISRTVRDWTNPPDTDTVAADFAAQIAKYPNPEFAFLLSHSGYIPEFYEHDSSQETLYSKLIEVLVCEWAKRIGFKDSHIQKQKASKEDVTIQIDKTVIVCDAKSYRLGRSQAAPNVKDTIKKADYEKWQEWWIQNSTKEKLFKPIGGLITFPSMHRWKGASDAYLYSTDKSKPITIIYYEHLAYYFLRGYNQDALIKLIASYPALFDKPSTKQHTYFESVVKCLFGDKEEDFFEFIKLFAEISSEKVANTMARIDVELHESHKVIEKEIQAINDVDKLKQQLIEALVENRNGQLKKNLINIKKFRTTPLEKKKKKG
jgi:hypothetical protein